MGLWSAFQLIINILIIIAIIINLIYNQGTARLKFVVVAAGFFTISYLINDFYLAATIVTMWLVFTGTHYYVSKEILLGLFALMFFLSTANPWFYLTGLLLYIITISNFVLSSFKKVHN